LPTVHGEKVVLRVLDTARTLLALDTLGMATPVLSAVVDALNATAGIVLVTGPTGSGKTSTLYAMLARVNRHDVNVVTIEEPVEYTLAGVQQVDVRADIGVTFSSALRAFLRQDPDVMMVGEIRDGETAAMAVRAALTGHLVLSTLHTNSAAETMTRLVDMGVAPFQLAAAVNAVVAQRLVRRVCAACRTILPVDVRDLLALDADPESTVSTLGVADSVLPSDVAPDTPLRKLMLARGAGCASCGGTGFAGRVALFEFLPLVPELRAMVQRGASHEVLRAAADTLGFPTLRMDGWRQALLGVTTLNQVARVTRR
jgi:type II secretory ATPase GspE/PulE/Tfp pilus assembly ATPase PilB-like protein